MRKLIISAVILLSIPLVHYLLYDALVVRHSSSSAIASMRGVDLVRELSRQLPPPSRLATVRTANGNGAVDYQKAFYKGEARKEELAFIESGAARKSCLFTSVILPIPDNLADFPVPNLRSARDYAEMMIAKAAMLGKNGDAAAAEKELLLLLSFGNHLESEYTLYTFLSGIHLEKSAADALHAHYTRSGDSASAAEMAAQAAEMERIRGSYKSRITGLARLTNDDSGREILRHLYSSPQVPAALKGELIFYNATQHLYFFTGMVYGPGPARRHFREELMNTKDPLLREIAEKSGSLLDLGVRDRLRAAHQEEVIE